MPYMLRVPGCCRLLVVLLLAVKLASTISAGASINSDGFGGPSSPCSTDSTCTCNFVQSPAEQSAQVLPLQCQFPEGNLFRYLNASTVSAVLDSSKLSPDTSDAWRMAFAVAAVRGGTVTVPAGNFVIASTVQLPKAVKIIGATQRGTGTPPTAFGSNILADFAGPVFSFSPPSSTSADILIQSLNIDGQKEKYSSSEGHGLAFSSCSNINLRDCVVANFAGNNVHFETGTGGDTYKIIARDVYSAQAGNANFYIGGEYSELHSCRTDGGKYGLFVDKQGFGLVVSDCHFEGSEVAGMHFLATRIAVTASRIVANVPGAIGVFCDAPLLHVTELEVHAAPTVGNQTTGVEFGSMAYQHSLSGVSSLGFGVGLRLRAGAGTVASGEFCGTISGIELIDGDCCQWASTIGAAVKACGGIHSILHSSGEGKWLIHTQQLSNAALTDYLPITVIQGAPMMLSPYAATKAPPSVPAAPTLRLPHGAAVVHVTGNGHITSVVADIGMTLRPVTLVFAAAVVVQDGRGNLRLAGDFISNARAPGGGAALTLMCDGLSWYETGRNIMHTAQ